MQKKAAPAPKVYRRERLQTRDPRLEQRWGKLFSKMNTSISFDDRCLAWKTYKFYSLLLFQSSSTSSTRGSTGSPDKMPVYSERAPETKVRKHTYSYKRLFVLAANVSPATRLPNNTLILQECAKVRSTGSQSLPEGTGSDSRSTPETKVREII